MGHMRAFIEREMTCISTAIRSAIPAHADGSATTDHAASLSHARWRANRRSLQPTAARVSCVLSEKSAPAERDDYARVEHESVASCLKPLHWGMADFQGCQNKKTAGRPAVY